MTPKRTHLALLSLIAAVTWLAGCAAGRPYLHWQGGDAFGVSAEGGREPAPLDCPGTLEQRFTCFARLLRERSAAISGTFAVVDDRGTLLHMTSTRPGQPVATTLDTPFALASITKMFTAATAVQLSRQGVLDLQRPIHSYLPELEAHGELGQISVHQLLTHSAGLLDPLTRRAGVLVVSSVETAQPDPIRARSIDFGAGLRGGAAGLSGAGRADLEAA